jgi:hypothetical protein
MGFEGSTPRLLRRYLLGTASGAALFGSAPFAFADTPTIDHIYLDVSGQYTMTGGHTNWAPPDILTLSGEPKIGVKSGFDGRGDLALQSGNWYLTLSADFARTGGSKASINENRYASRLYTSTQFHRDGVAKHTESHTVVDFTLGKDVGLGMFGLDGSSIISLGVRYAHFVARTRAHMHYFTYGVYHTASGSIPRFDYSSAFDRQIDRQFVGWGPVITWKGKAPVAPDFGFSWGLTAAAVAGGRSFEVDGLKIRHREVISPQVGGYVGLDWRMPDSPLDLMLGYRGDAYFNIIDEGFTVGKYGDRISHGPFVQIGWQLQ